MGMFCYQCQETNRGTGCTVQGVCGKDERTAALQDALLLTLRGVSFWAHRGRALGAADAEIDRFVAEGLFMTVTNVNFDPARFAEAIARGLALREKARAAFVAAGGKAPGGLPAAAAWACAPGDVEAMVAAGRAAGPLADADEELRSLKALLLYGCKGIAAYADHALVLGRPGGAVLPFLAEALAALDDPAAGPGELLALVLRAGKTAVDAMALLDEANAAAYGPRRVARVATGTRPGPGILVSGHDLKDLDELLRQAAGTGVNVYTHGEMLPAHAYAGLARHAHLAGNFGTSWHRQQREFEEFRGAILMTTNCLQKPRESYRDRLFTTGLVGWPGAAHVPDRVAGGEKDFGPVIARARALGDIGAREGATLTVGFAHETILGLADRIIEAVRAGDITRFVVMAGCDGRQREREYFTEVARLLPPGAVILTAGCAKYRYNLLDLGEVKGIPRVIDAGQCNDSYSLAVVALKLKEALGLADINDLPISYDIAWYEQKAVAVLLALLWLGVRNIRLGPTLPAFVSPGVLTVLVDRFGIRPTGSAEGDLPAILRGE